jgi:uncharacterized protein (DUF1501 family)
MLQSGLTRRQVLGRGLGAGIAFYAGSALSLDRVLDTARAQAADKPNAPILVVVFLPGGCDLLDTLVPLAQFGRYADLRPAIKLSDAVPVGRGDLGLHPALTRGARGGIKGLYDAGKVGFLAGIDHTTKDLSHFHSRHFWESGLLTPDTANGWLGRWLDYAGNADNPLQGVSMSYGLSPVLRSANAPVASVSSPEAAQFSIPGVSDEPFAAAMSTWAALADRNPSAPGPAAAARSARFAKVVADRLAPYIDSGNGDPTAGAGGYPEDNDFAQRLRHLAFMLAQPLGIRVVALDTDGMFDTHDSQTNDLATGLTNASEGLSAFQADLEARGIADRVLTFVWSEFGRRPEQNDSQGTDHGEGGVGWVQGTRARTGLLSDYPDLAPQAFDDLGNLAVTVDFRAVYASLLEQWLATDAGAVIPTAATVGRVQLVR